MDRKGRAPISFPYACPSSMTNVNREINGEQKRKRTSDILPEEMFRYFMSHQSISILPLIQYTIHNTSKDKHNSEEERRKTFFHVVPSILSRDQQWEMAMAMAIQTKLMKMEEKERIEQVVTKISVDPDPVQTRVQSESAIASPFP
jgi:hypothetical protein